MKNTRTAQTATIKYLQNKYLCDIGEEDVKHIRKDLAVYDGRDYWLSSKDQDARLLEVYPDNQCLYSGKIGFGERS